jgi:hypothetical protein
MAWLTTRAILAMDASAVEGALVQRGVSGPTLRSSARVALPDGALRPSPFDPNILRREAVSAALLELRNALDGLDRVTLVMPQGTARLVLLEVPAGMEGREYARFRLSSALPFPVTEAVVDVLPLGGGRALAAAVRKDVVAGYEEVAAEAGLAPERVDLLPLCAVGARLRERPAASLDVTLGDTAYSLALYEGGELAALRTRWRDTAAGEALRIGQEAQRTMGLGAGSAVSPRIRVSGAGRGELLGALAAHGHPVEEGEERAFLGAAVA